MNADDLAKILDELGRRLGPTGSHVFELAVRQIVINGIVSLIGAIGCFVALVAMLRWISRYAAADKAKDAASPYHTTSYEIAYALGGIGFLVLAATGAAFASAALSCLLNPEYAAIRDILGAVR